MHSQKYNRLQFNGGVLECISSLYFAILIKFRAIFMVN